MARPPKWSNSVLTRTSLSFFHISRFFPVAEKQKDMNLGNWGPTLSAEVMDLDDPFCFSFFSGFGIFSALSIRPVVLLKKAPNFDGLALTGAGNDGFGGGGTPTSFS